MAKAEKVCKTPILTLESKTVKNIPGEIKSHETLIFHCFGALEGILNGYEMSLVDAERTLDDMRDIVDFYNEEHNKYMEKL